MLIIFPFFLGPKLGDRYLLRLKSYVKNKNQPEGCIAEGYLVDECLTFCSRYMKRVETRLSRPSRNNDDGGIIEDVLPIFSMPGRPLGKGHIDVLDDSTREKAHQYVLFNCDDVETYKEYVRKIHVASLIFIV